MSLRPGYIRLFQTGELFERIRALNGRLAACNLCPRECGADRASGSSGVCGASGEVRVSAAIPHFGEEPALVGRFGSGTIFLSHCSLKCKFCQNHDISHGGDGRDIPAEELSSIMLRLHRQGCHNINFVTPTHYVPQIVEALPRAIEAGLDVPLIYNSSGYESVEVLKLLDGIFDIYMPDLKYSDDSVALSLSGVKGYFEAAKAAIKEMHRQAGDLLVSPEGLAMRGLIIRHLVLPEGLSGTSEAMRFIAREISRNTCVNIMDQYRPAYRAFEDKRISRRTSGDEFNAAVEVAVQEGLTRIEGYC